MRTLLPLLALLLLLAVPAAAAPPPGCCTAPQDLPAPWRIMTLGDQITAADGTASGYRPYLKTLIQRGSSGVAQPLYVGSLGHGWPPGPEGHEGHAGYRISGLNSQVATWLALNPPDVVLLMAGTLDIRNGVTPAGAAAQLDGLIGTIHAAQPDAWIVVGTIPQVWPTDPDIDAYNALVRTGSGFASAAYPEVQFAGAGECLDPATQLAAGGLLPTQAGYDRIAACWFRALEQRVRM